MALVRQLLSRDANFDFEASPLAPPETIELAHDSEYVRNFIAVGLPPAAMRRIGLPWSEILVQRALASVGGTLRAADDALELGWGGTLGGGTHHAFRAEGAGFCVFNDVAVAVQLLRSAGRIRRAAAVDLDVHQGDGTAQIFRDDREVFTLSIHCQSNFPFRKQQSVLDVALPDRVGDDEYLHRLDEVLPLVFAFRPDIIFYQSGVDGLATDLLGHLSLTHDGLMARDRKVMQAAHWAGVPLVVTSGGGYASPIELSAEAHANTYRTAWDIFGNPQALKIAPGPILCR
jgi:acetoin utilization deacetylase AcuC-like enzyme